MTPPLNVPVVRLAELEIDPARIESFKAAATENIATTLDSEAGVLEFHAAEKKGHPGRVVVLEAYADQTAYLAHLRTPHYEKFVAAVAPLVWEKILHEAMPVILGRKPGWSAPSPHVRIAELEIEPARLAEYKTAVTEEIEASIRVEPGVMAIFCVALKEAPHRLRFLEIYADEDAYLRHRESPHFRKYLEITKPMIRSLSLFEAEQLGPGGRPAPRAPSSGR